MQAVGGRVIAASVAGNAVRASVPLTAVESLAGKAGVQHVDVAAQAMLANEGGRVAPASKAELTKRISGALAQAKAAPAAAPAATTAAVTQGSVVSEGDKAHGADAARARFKVTGTGVTVGVLSDGVDSLAASIASGDLPADTRVLPGQAGDGDEGTAMMEIVHDLAPNAHLIFATAFTSEESFADNIRALRAAGADIIVDDVVYFAESPFQDSGPAQAVIDVTNDGALYFSSAGNEQNVDDRTAGNWEGDYDAVRPDDRQVRRRGARLGSGPGHPGAQPGLRRLRRRADDPAVERPAGPLRQRLRPVRGGCRRLRARVLQRRPGRRRRRRSRASTCRSAPSAWPW